MCKILFFRSVILFSLVAILFLSCSEDRVLDIDDSLYGYEYFPMEIGKYWLYRVDSTIVDDGGATIIESRSYVREEVVDSFINQTGQKTFIIHRSYSDTEAGPYATYDAWSSEITEQAAVRTEENLRFVKLVFPANLNAKWKGNLFDPLTRVDIAGERIWVYKDWGDYSITQKNVSVPVNGIQYNGVLVVEQADFESAVERRISREYYAPDIGLIKKEMTILDTQCLCPGEAWEEKAEAGFIMNQVLIESN